MITEEIPVLARNLQHVEDWITDLRGVLDCDAHRAWRALAAVLQTLRDRITVEEAADLAAQLPLIMQGVFYDGWHPAGTPQRIRDADAFFALIEERAGTRGDGVALFQAVITALQARLPAGELEQVRGMLPAAVTAHWPTG